jgi:hypothetical protein
MISFGGIWTVVVCLSSTAEDVCITDVVIVIVIVVIATAVGLRVVGVVCGVLGGRLLTWRLIIVSKITRFMALRNGLTD